MVPTTAAAVEADETHPEVTDTGGTVSCAARQSR